MLNIIYGNCRVITEKVPLCYAVLTLGSSYTHTDDQGVPHKGCSYSRYTHIQSYGFSPIPSAQQKITITRLYNILRHFTVVKYLKFRMKYLDIFLIFAQSIDRGYTLEQPQ